VDARDLLNFGRNIVAAREQVKQLFWELKTLFQLDSIAFSGCTLGILIKVILLVFLDDLKHSWACLLHEFLKLEGFIDTLLLSLVLIFVLHKVHPHIFWSLIELIFVAQVFCLNFLVDVVLICRSDCGLDGAVLNFIVVHILGSLRHNLEDVEVLFLTEFNEVS